MDELTEIRFPDVCPVPDCVHLEADSFTDADWRLLCLLERGFPVAIAEQLAAAGFGQHDVDPLLDAGATPEQAAKVLL